jgi:hypothetical protein
VRDDGDHLIAPPLARDRDLVAPLEVRLQVGLGRGLHRAQPLDVALDLGEQRRALPPQRSTPRQRGMRVPAMAVAPMPLAARGAPPLPPCIRQTARPRIAGCRQGR